ncbi:hypothetical protein M513_03359, partial [Trichuris suis]
STFQESYPLTCGPNPTRNKPRVKEVPYYRRPWNRKYLRYNPKHWNETCRFDECDPDITSPVFQPKFNTIDGNVNRKRVKACGENLTYEVVDGFPLNSAGRTGLTGRGILPHYGPNHMMGVIFVWEKGDKVIVLKRSGKTGYADGFLTGYVSDPEEQPFPDVPLQLIKKSLKKEFKDTEKINKILRNARKRFVKLMGGSVPSDLETDHAWIELEMFLVPCKKTKKLCRYGLVEIREEYGLQWYDMNTDNVEEIHQNVTSLIDSRRDDYEGYSIYCVPDKKYKTIIGFILGNILLIGGISVGVALLIASLAAGGAIMGVIGFCLASKGLEKGDKVIVLKRSGKTGYADGFLTGYVSDPEEQPFPDVPLQLIKKSLKKEFKDKEKVNKILRNAKKRFVKLIGGSVPSGLETDHAWVELQMFLVPCKKTKKLCTYGLLEIREEYGLQWYDMNTDNVEEMQRNVTTLIDTRRDNYERYSIYCVPEMKYKHIISVVVGNLMLITGVGVGIALLVGSFAVNAAILGAIGLPMAVGCLFEFGSIFFK